MERRREEKESVMIDFRDLVNRVNKLSPKDGTISYFVDICRTLLSRNICSFNQLVYLVME